MEHQKDIESLEDIKNLVDTFYGKVKEDELIGPIFNKVIQDRWPVHLEKMYTFWQTVLLGEHTYYGSPFPPHAHLPVSAEHFNTWKGLFNATVNEQFKGPVADEAIWRADKMAQMFQSKIAFYKENTNRSPLP